MQLLHLTTSPLISWNTPSFDYLLDTIRAYETAPLCYELIILLYYFLSQKINDHCINFSAEKSSITKVNIINFGT